MRCECGHSQIDHLTGRCVNRTMHFDQATGATVTTVCPCKAFVKESPPAPVEEPKAQEPEAKPESGTTAKSGPRPRMERKK